MHAPLATMPLRLFSHLLMHHLPNALNVKVNFVRCIQPWGLSLKDPVSIRPILFQNLLQRQSKTIRGVGAYRPLFPLRDDDLHSGLHEGRVHPQLLQETHRSR
jgi:hypothetical protein